MAASTNEGTSRIGLFLNPLDVLLFRDGRPLEPGYRVGGGLPFPQTLAGALRTALLAETGFDFRAFSKEVRNGQTTQDALRSLNAPDWIIDARVRGPWFGIMQSSGDVEPLLPIPASLWLHSGGGKWGRRSPLRAEIPGWNLGHPQLGLRPLWDRTERTRDNLEGFLTLSGIRRFLRGQIPEWGDFYGSSDLFEIDYRTGIAINPATFSVEEGQIYSAGMTVLNPNVREGLELGFYSELVFPKIACPEEVPLSPAHPIPLGGQSRYVSVRPVAPVEWPQHRRSETNADGELLFLATPGIFRRGWVPDIPSDARWAAAAVPGSLPVSGWDIARAAPKPTRFAVPAGSVYFHDGEIPIDDGCSLCADPEDAAQGWGFALRGVWNYV